MPAPPAAATRGARERVSTPPAAIAVAAARISSAETVDLSTPSPTPTNTVYRRPPARLLTSRIAMAVAARAESTGCECCAAIFTTPARDRPPSQLDVSLLRRKCACCKRLLRAVGVSTGQQGVKKTEIRCLDCEKAGRKGLVRVRQVLAEKKRLANESRKATLANKKRQQQEDDEQDEEEDEEEEHDDEEEKEPHVKAARKRREQRMQKNFATFSRLIMQGMGGNDERGESDDDTTERGLARLRQDRARRGRSLVGTKRRKEDSSSGSSDESEHEPLQRTLQAQGKRRRSEAVSKRKETGKKVRAKAPEETSAQAEASRPTVPWKQRAPPSPEIIEIDDSD